MTDKEIVKAVRKWLDNPKETDVEMRYIKRACWLAEQHLSARPEGGRIRWGGHELYVDDEGRLCIKQDSRGHISDDLRAPHTEAAWRSPKDKPPHLPGEHHSQDVLLLMKKRGLIDDQRIKIGHVSVGHWRPSGGNGNFDDDVEGWMPLPSLPGPQMDKS